MNTHQKTIFQNVLHLEPYLIGMKLNSMKFAGLRAIELIIHDEDTQIYFSHPSSNSSKFASLTADILEYYNTTF